MAQSLFKWLRSREEDVAIDVVAPPGPLSLTGRMPEVRKAVALDVSHGELHLGRRWSVGRGLRPRRYDQAIVLPSSFKSALLPWFAGIPTRTGYRGELRFGLLNDIRSLNGAASEQNVRGYLGLGVSPGEAEPPDVPRPALRVDSENRDRLVRELGLQEERPVVALAPGAAYGPSKRWPAERFARLAERVAGRGAAVWVLGTAADASVGEAIVHGIRGARNLCGSTTLTDAVDVLSLADAVVANDSGLMHVAAAVGSPVVAIFGPTAPTFAPPLSDRSTVLYRGVACSPCEHRDCPYGHHDCMQTITVDDVARSIAERLPDG